MQTLVIITLQTYRSLALPVLQLLHTAQLEPILIELDTDAGWDTLTGTDAQAYLPIVTPDTLKSPLFQRVLKRLHELDTALIPLVSSDLLSEYPYPHVVDLDADNMDEQVLHQLNQHFPVEVPSGSNPLRWQLTALGFVFGIILVLAALFAVQSANPQDQLAMLPTLVEFPTETPESQIAESEQVQASSATLSAQFTASVVDGAAPLAVEFSVDAPIDGAVYTWDFGVDAATDSGALVSFLFERAGVVTVTLNAELDGITVSTYQTIIVRPNTGATGANDNLLLAEFSVSENYGSAPLIVQFENRSLGDIARYEWDFDGDGTVDSEEEHSTYTYEFEGIFSATLTIYDAEGESDTISTEIEVVASDEVDENSPTNAAFSVSQQTGVAPASITFFNQSTGKDLTYSWDFNGDAVADSTAESPPPYVYQNVGRYQASLTVEDANGTLSRTRQFIIILQTDNIDLIEADFTASPARGSAPLLVRFTNSSTGDIATYAWDFNGDGVIDSRSANPGSFSFSKAGVYDATLLVTSAGGNQKTASLSIIVEPPGLNGNGTIFADFSADKVSGSAPMTVQFTNQSSGSITRVEWDFNKDGRVDSTALDHATFTYNAAGSYEATLTVFGADGDTANTSLQIEVEDQAQQLSANFFAIPTNGVAPLTVKFLNYAKGDIARYEWDFNGDGTVDNTQQTPPQYTYTKAGVYQSILTVYNADGVSRQSSVQIIVLEPLKAQFTLSANKGNTPFSVTATNTSTGNISSYRWDFNGDGIIDSTLPNPLPFTYSAAGNFTISLLIGDELGATSRYEQLVSVTGAPVVSPSPELTPEVTVSVTVSPSPELTTSVTVSPSPEITPEVTVSPSPEITTSLTVSPSPEVTTSPAVPTAETTPDIIVTQPSPSVSPSPEVTQAALPELTPDDSAPPSP